MSGLNNNMVIGDNGEHPSSPYYRVRSQHKCSFCNEKVDSTTTAEYVLETAPEDEMPQQGDLCDDCLASKLIVLV